MCAVLRDCTFDDRSTNSFLDRHPRRPQHLPAAQPLVAIGSRGGLTRARAVPVPRRYAAEGRQRRRLRAGASSTPRSSSNTTTTRRTTRRSRRFCRSARRRGVPGDRAVKDWRGSLRADHPRRDHSTHLRRHRERLHRAARAALAPSHVVRTRPSRCSRSARRAQFAAPPPQFGAQFFDALRLHPVRLEEHVRRCPPSSGTPRAAGSSSVVKAEACRRAEVGTASRCAPAVANSRATDSNRVEGRNFTCATWRARGLALGKVRHLPAAHRRFPRRPPPEYTPFSARSRLIRRCAPRRAPATRQRLAATREQARASRSTRFARGSMKSNRRFYAAMTGKRAIFERQLLPRRPPSSSSPSLCSSTGSRCSGGTSTSAACSLAPTAGGGQYTVWIDGVGSMSTVAQFRLRPAPYALARTEGAAPSSPLLFSPPILLPTGTTRRCRTSTILATRSRWWSPPLATVRASTPAEAPTTTTAATRR